MHSTFPCCLQTKCTIVRWLNCNIFGKRSSKKQQMHNWRGPHGSLPVFVLISCPLKTAWTGLCQPCLINLASSDDNRQGTVQVAASREVRTDEGTSYSCLNYPNFSAINTQVVFQPNFELGGPDDLASVTLSWKAWSSVVVAMAWEKERGAMMIDALKVFSFSRNKTTSAEERWRCHICPSTLNRSAHSHVEETSSKLTDLGLVSMRSYSSLCIR